MTSPPLVIPGAVLLCPSCSRRCGGSFSFSSRVPCGVLCASLQCFSFRVYTFIPFCVSFSVRPVWRLCCYPRTFQPGVWCFQRLYIARLRRSGMPIAAPYCSPCRVCAAFSFSWCNFTLLYFSFVLWLSCGVVCRLRLACVGVWRLPWPSVGRSCGGGACISGRRCSRLWASGAVVGVVRVQAWPEAVRACSAWSGRFFAGSALIAPPGLPGEGACLRQSRCGKVAKSKVDEGAPESRCSQVLPHSRYSR